MVKEARPTLLLIVHAWGGGVIHYARLLRDHVAARVNVVFAWGVEDRSLCISTRDPEMPEQTFDLSLGLEAPVTALQAFGVRRVDLLCTIGLQAHVEALLDRLSVPFDVTLLAYELLASSAHLMDGEGRFVGEDAISSMAQARTLPFVARALLPRADRLIACSRDLAWRAGRFLPGYPILPARPPEKGAPHKVPPRLRPLLAGEPLRVLVLGRLAPHKGLRIIDEVARLADIGNAPIEILCLGEAQVPTSALPASPRVRLLGRYDVGKLRTLVPRLRPHLAWFPFTVPETHSFTLSEAMSLALPVLATGIGAVPERVEGRAATWLLPPAEASAEGFFRCFEELREQGLSTPARWMPTGHLPPLLPDFYEDDYLAPLCGPGPASIDHRRPAATDAARNPWRHREDQATLELASTCTDKRGDGHRAGTTPSWACVAAAAGSPAHGLG